MRVLPFFLMEPLSTPHEIFHWFKGVACAEETVKETNKAATRGNMYFTMVLQILRQVGLHAIAVSVTMMRKKSIAL